jgi:hypothetical protein
MRRSLQGEGTAHLLAPTGEGGQKLAAALGLARIAGPRVAFDSDASRGFTWLYVQTLDTSGGGD